MKINRSMKLLLILLTLIIVGVSFGSITLFADKAQDLMELSYMKGEGAGEQYGINTIENGPDGISTEAFIDAENGQLSLYMGTSNGVQVFKDNGSNYLKKLEGIEGSVLAIGGKTEKDLTAVVRDKVVDGMTMYYKHYIYDYNINTNQWVKNEKSHFGDMNLYGLIDRTCPAIVMDKNDIWLFDIHWDGSKWIKNDVKFDDIYKQNEDTAWGISTDKKIYKYQVKDKKWMEVKISNLPSKYNQTSVPKLKAGKNGILILKNENNFYKIEKNIAEKIDIKIDNVNTIEMDSKGNFYALARGKYYSKSGSGGYYGTNIYKLVGKEWKLQTIPAFNDMKEPKEEGKKFRPDGVESIVSPIDGVDVFLGKAGANYLQTDEHKIIFDSNGGSKVDNLVGKARGVIQPPTPKKEGFVFRGWFLDKEGLKKYEFTTFPAKDINLYAKWSKLDKDELASDRIKALSGLEKSLGKRSEQDFERTEWDRVQSIYKTGIYEINIVEGYQGVYNALNETIANMDAVPVGVEKEITVCVSMEKFTLGQGYIIEPTLVKVKNYEQASKVVTDLLKKKYPNEKQPWEMTGKVDSGFYLSSVFDPNRPEIKVPKYITDKAEIDKEMFNGDWLGEFDYYYMSGWMYSINNSFPNVGASAWRMNDGEVMRWQFTLYGYGADLGSDNSDWGTDSITKVGDKTRLTYEVAKHNSLYTKDELGKNPSYKKAMEVLLNPMSDQKTIDEALGKLEVSNTKK